MRQGEGSLQGKVGRVTSGKDERQGRWITTGKDDQGEG